MVALRYPLLTAAVASLALGVTASAAAAEPSELIVRFEPGASAADRLDAREGAGTELARKLPVPGMQLVEVEPGQSAAAADTERT